MTSDQLQKIRAAEDVVDHVKAEVANTIQEGMFYIDLVAKTVWTKVDGVLKEVQAKVIGG